MSSAMIKLSDMDIIFHDSLAFNYFKELCEHSNKILNNSSKDKIEVMSFMQNKSQRFWNKMEGEINV